MNYVDFLRKEAEGSHAQFHQFLLTVGQEGPDSHYFFFEGDDDPLFYLDQAQSFLENRTYYEFICQGREGVLKVHELVARDGRASDRTHFFVDKDHNDIMGGVQPTAPSVFQTYCYSFENYLVCDRVLRRFWGERLHLPSTDQRLAETMELFREMRSSLMKRMRILMAIVLIGRGIEGRQQLKLNLNNINLDKVLKIDLGARRVGWMRDGFRHFLSASNMTQAGIGPVRSSDIRRICRRYLAAGDPKHYVRGKFELWFLVRFLMIKTKELADRKLAASAGVARARPKENITLSNCIIQLAPLCPCPQDVSRFLISRLGNPQP